MLGASILLASVVLGPPAPPRDETDAATRERSTSAQAESGQAETGQAESGQAESDSPETGQTETDPPEPDSPEPGPATHAQLVLTVLVRGRRDPVAGARVYPLPSTSAAEPDGQAADTQVSATAEPLETDERGRLRAWQTPGLRRFELRAEGFEALTFEVELVVGERAELELRLEEARGGNRYRTVVESERAEIALSRTKLREEEIHELPGSAGDPFSVVRSLPGASQVAGFLPYVVVRGAAPGNTGYYLDGVRVPLLFHVAAGPSVIHPYFIEEVDFYAGGAPVRLGRYASGIVEGRTREAGRDRLRGEVDLRLTDAGALLEIPFDRPLDRDCLAQAEAAAEAEAGLESASTPTSARARKQAERSRRRDCRGPGRGTLSMAGRYSYTGLILSAIPSLNIKLRFWDYQLRLDHDLGRRARYTALVFGSYDELGPAQALVDEIDEDGEVVSTVDDDPDPYVRFEFHRIDQRIRQRLRGGGRIDYKLALGLDRSGVQDIRIDEWRVAPRIDARVPLGEHLDLGLGLDQEVQIFRLPAGLTSASLGANVEDLALLLGEREVSVTGLYADLSYRRGRFEIRPGVRVDLWVQRGVSPYLPQARSMSTAIGVDPRVQVRERLSPRWTLRQSLGVYHQPPDPPLPIPGIESIGLSDGLQRNIQGAFGFEWRLAEWAELSADAYLGRLSNMQDYELSEGFAVDEYEDFLVRVSGWSWGVETMLRLIPDGRFYGWLAYTLSWSYRDFPVGGWAPATWDQRHILNAVAGWAINSKWRLGGRFHVNSGRPYTTVERLDDGTLEDLNTAMAEHRNNARLPAFLQLDARVERVFTLRDLRLHLYLDLTNANLAREVLRCDSLAETDDPSAEILRGCVNPQAIRYVLPSLGFRAVF